MAFFDKAPQFTFVSRGGPGDSFAVVSFKGVEGLSWCYDFEINLVSSRREIDMEEVLANPATLTIKAGEQSYPFHGVLASFELLREVSDYVFYRARLMPRFWWLHYTRNDQIFLDKSLEDILDSVLRDGGLQKNDFDIRLNESYDPYDYVCQYGESHLNFVSRWMEHWGLYYFFEQTQQGDKLVITDSKSTHAPAEHGETLKYSPPSGLDAWSMDQTVRSFNCVQTLVPKKLQTRDFNYKTPSLDIKGEADISDKGRGEVNLYGQCARNTKESKRLAAIRAEEYASRRQRFQAESSIASVRTGYLFTLKDHYRDDFNRQYLAVRVEHSGSQAGYMVSGLRDVLSNGEAQSQYRNRFECIPADVQYRPRCESRRPVYSGVAPAHIDASGNGEYAELDEQGRYTVRMPFDESDRPGGKASHQLRMAQPYQGEGFGMSCPLHKGTETLVSFMEGNPDYPIIAAAVANPETPSPITSANQTKATIKTAGQNHMTFEDKKDGERILLQTPNANTWVRLGTANDPFGTPNDPSLDIPDIIERLDNAAKDVGDALKKAGKWVITPKGNKPDGYFWGTAGNSGETALGDYSVKVGGLSFSLTMGMTNKAYGGMVNSLSLSWDHSTTLGVSSSIILSKMSMTIFNQAYKGDDFKGGLKKTFLQGWGNKVAAAQTDVSTTSQDVGLALQQVQAQATEIAGNKMQSIADELSAKANDLEQRLARVSASTQETLVHTDDIKTSLTKVKSAANSVKSAGNALKTAGSSMENGGTGVTNTGSYMVVAGSRMKSGGIIMIN
ncbi:MAG: type VI secretion system Vgr family protein [Desulfovibrio sp.]|uniref:type VI secretion system Vgr family protein n=1 Tax=Desulfovibrio sp. 7SRBS1 TaxID=3378064 RepID=UPI003B3E2246